MGAPLPSTILQMKEGQGRVKAAKGMAHFNIFGAVVSA